MQKSFRIHASAYNVHINFVCLKQYRCQIKDQLSAFLMVSILVIGIMPKNQSVSQSFSQLAAAAAATEANDIIYVFAVINPVRLLYAVCV